MDKLADLKKIAPYVLGGAAVLAVVLVGSKFLIEASDAQSDIELNLIQPSKLTATLSGKTQKAPEVKSAVQTKAPSKIDKTKFFATIQSSMQEVQMPTASESLQREKLSELNAYGIEGSKLILNELRKGSWTDAEVVQDLSLIDYLKYKVKWDEESRKLVAEAISEPRPDALNSRDQAVWVSSRVELMEALAAADIDSSYAIARKTKDTFYKNQLRYGILMSLIEKGVDRPEAIKTVDRNVL